MIFINAIINLKCIKYGYLNLKNQGESLFQMQYFNLMWLQRIKIKLLPLYLIHFKTCFKQLNMFCQFLTKSIKVYEYS